MKRIGIATTVGALALVMLVPAAASAHSAPAFWSVLLKNTCVTTGGEHGFGKIKLGMEAYATNNDPDAPTTNYIVIRSKFQQKNAGKWATIGSTRVTTPVYADGHPDVFRNLLIEGYSFESADHPRMRMIMRVEFWDGLESGDVLLGTTRVQSAAC
jgi:hypothetical protein